MGDVEAAQSLAWLRPNMSLHTKLTAANAKPVLDVGAPGIHLNVLQGLSLQSWQEKGKHVAWAATGESSALLPKFHSPWGLAAVSAPPVQVCNLLTSARKAYRSGSWGMGIPHSLRYPYPNGGIKGARGVQELSGDSKATAVTWEPMETGAPKVVTGAQEQRGCLS